MMEDNSNISKNKDLKNNVKKNNISNKEENYLDDIC